MVNWNPKSRLMTNKILEAVEAGLIDKDYLIMACLKYMSESEVADMAHANELFGHEEEEDDDDGV
jgi:hypothetical protein